MTNREDEAVTAEPIIALRRAIATPGRKIVVVLALSTGVLVAGAVALVLPPTERTFLAIMQPVQSVLSIFVPFVTVLLVRDLAPDHGRRQRRLIPTLLAAGIVAVIAAGFGIALSALATELGGAGAQRWQSAGLLVGGSLVLQLVAASVGTGLGQLIGRPVLAALSTIALPLGTYLVLGSTPTLREVREWVTPFAAVQQLFSGRLTVLDWIQWLAVFLVWGVALNVLGRQRSRRRRM